MRRDFKFIYFGLLIVSTVLHSCKKDENANIITDIDGNTYNTVTIGNQIWMKENLRVIHYNDGTEIPRCYAGSEWENQTQGAYGAIDNSSETFITYGALYNWYAVNDSHGLAPEGWHIPTDAEWTILINVLGGEELANNKLRETGSTHWLGDNTNATNTSGFTALPGGVWFGDGNFAHFGEEGYWWTSTESDATHAWNRSLYIDSKVLKKSFDKRSGFSVRCIKSK